MFFQIGGQTLGRAPVARQATAFLHQKSADVGFGRLVVFRRNAVIADKRIGHGDDLTGVGGVGEDFLVAGHTGIKDHFAQALTTTAQSPTFEDGAVRERDEGFHRTGCSF